MQPTAPIDAAHDFVAHVNDLPTLGGHVHDLLRLLESPHANFIKVARLVREDPVLSAKVMRAANSAYYYGDRSVSSLEAAMGRLGLDELRNIAMASSMMGTFSKVGRTLDATAFWRHCIGSANACSLLAHWARTLAPAEKKNGSAFYVCGLLHHLGILLQAWAEPDRLLWAMRASVVRKVPLYETEREIFGFDHAHSGAALLRRWKFPELVVESALHHHDPEEGEPGHLNYTRVTHLSAMLCHGLDGQASFEGHLEGFSVKSFFALGLEVESLPALNGELTEILGKSIPLAAALVA